MNILVTVGMSAWPFDRLIAATLPLCSEHNVFIQTGASRIAPPCESAPFVSYLQLQERIHNADVVITHAGNTIRLVQRAGKVPVAIARTAANREMPNDHQVEFLRHEEQGGRVIAVWDVAELPTAVASHADTEAELLAQRPLNQPADPAALSKRLNELWYKAIHNPFRYHPLRRYAFAWDELGCSRGKHLDIGCGTGEFFNVLAGTTQLECFAVDPHAGYLGQLGQGENGHCISQISIHSELPFPNQTFHSVSLLDVLEHVPNEDKLLGEIYRVLGPNGRLVLTVPAHHVFSWLDPDNAKFRYPHLHRFIYSTWFGHEIYHERFVDLSNNLRGDMSVGKDEHTNYQKQWLIDRLEDHGFETVRSSGANLFWRWFQTPALLGGKRIRRLFERLIWLDGEIFQSANLFLSARKRM
jgi:ubiquinone/menaquinone biosynthesis C-methylase UbiE/UDP-N-acetylglucosamine transferase subunit ALG13